MSIIYILTNPAMPGLVKIGKTKKLKQRLRGLDITPVPLPFRCAYAARVTNVDAAEKLLHDAFGDRRVRDNREFFEIDPMRVISALKLAGGKEVTPNDDIAKDEGGVEAANRVTSLQPVFYFGNVNVPVGSILTFSEDETITAVVQNRKKVEFEGELKSLSAAAVIVLNRRGRNWKNVNGLQYWVYDGETIHERRARMEREAAEVDED